jgi:hypothetical protein
LDRQDLRIEPAPPVGGAAPVRAVQADAAARGATNADSGRQSQAAAVTGGGLRAAYAQFVVDADTHEVVVRIRDASTDEILNEMPSREVQEVEKYLRTYAETLARHRAALRRDSAD